MIIVFLLQNGECHISSYRRSDGNYLTICSKIVDKNSYANTLGTDDTFSGTCSICKSSYDKRSKHDLLFKPAFARSSNISNLWSTLEHHREGIAGPEANFYGFEDRIWYKLFKYQKMIAKANPKKHKANKYKFYQNE